VTLNPTGRLLLRPFITTMTSTLASPQILQPADAVPARCVIVVDAALPPGRAANAAAVLALTIGARHPGLVGAPLVDGSGFEHPGLIPIGIPVLAADQAELTALRGKALDGYIDVVDFPVQGQQTTHYDAFRDAVKNVPPEDLRYVGIALVGDRKPIGKIVGKLGLMA
jgi:hypothetical protein